jgi:hypothetical protein
MTNQIFKPDNLKTAVVTAIYPASRYEVDIGDGKAIISFNRQGLLTPAADVQLAIGDEILIGNTGGNWQFVQRTGARRIIKQVRV